jgi:branched-chain amino acid transport system permease protein
MIQTIIIYGIIWTFLYSLIAIGFSLIFGVADVVNLTHGMVIMAASYVVFLLVSNVQISLAISMLSGIIAAALLLIIIYLVFIRRMLKAPHTSMLLLTIGIAMMLQQVIILVAGTQTRYVPSIISGSRPIWGVVLSNQQILSVVVAFALVLSLGSFLKWGRQGRAIRAVSQDREIAAASGVSPNVIFILTVVISGTLAGIAGVLVSPIEVVTPEAGWGFMVTAFSVTVLAGLGGPIWGIVVSAAIVSYAELLTAFFIAPMLKEAAAFTILIFTLMFKPSGLFGKKRI